MPSCVPPRLAVYSRGGQRENCPRRLLTGPCAAPALQRVLTRRSRGPFAFEASMGRICNRTEIFETIIKYFGLIDGQLHRRYKHRDELRRITGTMRKDYLIARVNQAYVCVHHIVMVDRTSVV